MIPGAKATGSSLGLAGAAMYAPEATIVTKAYAMGYPLDPMTLEAAVTKLTEAAWGGLLIGCGLMGGLVAGYVWRKAQARWGDEPAATPPAPPLPAQ